MNEKTGIMGGHHHHDHKTGNIKIAFFLNTVFAIVELIGGFLTNSVAILSDALHDFGDSLSLGIAWYLQKKSSRPKDDKFTYGYKRFSLLSAFINAIVLVVGSVFVIKEAIRRIRYPEQADVKGMMFLAVLGVVFNFIAMMRLKKGSSINERVVSLHFLEDILGWVAVLIGAIIMYFFDAPIIDPILSLVIAGFILVNIYKNLKPAFRIILQGTPDTEIESSVKEKILENKQIVSVHDYRLWSLDGEENVLTLHVVVNELMDLKQAEFLKEHIKQQLASMHITHATIEIEYQPEHCGDTME